MKISELNKCIETMRECYPFSYDNTKIWIGSIENPFGGSVSVETHDENGTKIMLQIDVSKIEK